MNFLGSLLSDSDLVELVEAEIGLHLEEMRLSEDAVQAVLLPLLVDVGGQSAAEASVTCWQIHEHLAADTLSPPPSSDELDEDALGDNECEMCERVMPLTFHHLFPRKVHKRLQEKTLKGHSEARGIPKDQLRNEGILICRPCHSALHRMHDHNHLAKELNTLDRIVQDAKMLAWIEFARKQKELPKSHGRLRLQYKR